MSGLLHPHWPPTGFKGAGDDVTLQHSCTSAAAGPPPSAAHMLPPCRQNLPPHLTPPHLLTCTTAERCRFHITTSAVELDCRESGLTGSEEIIILLSKLTLFIMIQARGHGFPPLTVGGSMLVFYYYLFYETSYRAKMYFMIVLLTRSWLVHRNWP